jgi:hypothetical protein
MSPSHRSTDTIIAEYLAAKALEADATARRVALGEELASCFEAPEEGSKTHSTYAYKVTLKGVVNRRVDWDAFDAAAAHFEGKPLPVVVKRELDVKGLRWVEEHEPELHRALAASITSTPGRTGIEIKPKGDK